MFKKKTTSNSATIIQGPSAPQDSESLHTGEPTTKPKNVNIMPGCGWEGYERQKALIRSFTDDPDTYDRWIRILLDLLGV